MAAPAGDGLDVHGGSGGVDAQLDDLAAAAALLRRCAGELVGVAGRLARLVGTPGVQAGALLSPTTLAAVDARAAAAVAGPHGLLRAAAGLDALGVAVAAAVSTYRGADAAADGAVHQVELAGGAAAGRLAPVLVPGAVAVGAGVLVGSGGDGAAAGTWLLNQLAGHGDLGEQVVAAGPGFLDGLLLGAPPGAAVPGVLAAGLPVRDVPGLAGVVGGAGVAVPGLREPAQVQARALPGREQAPPRDLADLTARIASCYPPPGSPGADGSGGGPDTARVRVDRVTGADGRRAWVVTVPGQQQMSLRGGTNPFDLAGDVHAMAGHDTAARQGVLAAMRSAQIPPGEPVLLAGHSQGGMVAASLAADPQVRQRYRITHLVTVGSPVAEYRVPDDVQVLSVEHTDDAVPKLDGRANPARAGWVTVRRPVHAPGVPVDALAAHDLAAYQDTMARVDGSDDPSLRAYRAGLAPFLDHPGAVGHTTEVTLRRGPAGQG